MVQYIPKKVRPAIITEMRTLKMERQGSRKDQEVDDRKEKMGSERRPIKSIQISPDYSWSISAVYVATYWAPLHTGRILSGIARRRRFGDDKRQPWSAVRVFYFIARW